MENVETDIDDFLIWGTDDDAHNERLIEVLERLKKNNITLNIKILKCFFGVQEVTYLGHRINRDGSISR